MYTVAWNLVHYTRLTPALLIIASSFFNYFVDLEDRYLTFLILAFALFIAP